MELNFKEEKKKSTEILYDIFTIDAAMNKKNEKEKKIESKYKNQKKNRPWIDVDDDDNDDEKQK